MKLQRCVRIAGDFIAFSAIKIGIPNDAAFVKTLYPGAQPPTGSITLTGADVDLIVALLNARQSEIDTTAARFRRSSAQIKTVLKR